MLARLAAPALLLLTLGAALAQGQTGDLEALRSQSLELVNEARQDNGLEPLEQSPVLNESALAHARDMLARGFYSHTAPGGSTPRDRFLAAGGNPAALVAENIGQCSPCGQPPDDEDVRVMHQGWMNSPEHRENILGEGLARYGFAIVSGEAGLLLAVQTFAGPGTSLGAGEGEPVPIETGSQTDLAAELVNAARQEAGLARLETSAALSDGAGQLLPDPGAEDFSLGRIGDIRAAIPQDERNRWMRVAAIAGSCSGCGSEVVEADIEHFVASWLDDPDYRAQLLDPDFSAMGLRVLAGGNGRKAALLLLGDTR